MKKQIIISYEWWVNEGDSIILIDDREELERAAMMRIEEMQRDDYTSGELHHCIDDRQYNGHWSLTMKTVF